MRRADWITSAVAFLASLITYCLTVAPTASFWDCPEYITTAVGLQVGHPPGNPLWTLLCRVASMFAPAGKEALFVNLTSSLFTAIAIALVCRIAFASLQLISEKCYSEIPVKTRALACGICSLCGSMSLAWCDSVWFSAVEAEVYALSLMLTALCLMVMVIWARLPRHTHMQRRYADRYLVLTAYLLGLSMGAHQLNLLVIPALTLIVAFRLSPSRKRPVYTLSALLAGCVIIVLLLKGTLTGTARLACDAELLMVNGLHCSYNSGVVAYITVAVLSAVTTPLLLGLHSKTAKIFAAIDLMLLMFCSGIFMFLENIGINIILSVAVAVVLVYTRILKRHQLVTMSWMLTMILIGFSVYLIIPIRSASNPTLNESQPADAFSYYSYLSREQYGSNPLLFGPTPYSRPVVNETYINDSTPQYRYYKLERLSPQYVRKIPGMQIANNSRMLNADDSLRFANLQKREGDAYQLADYRYRTVDIPELNMFFSRLHGRKKEDIDSYKSWAGMDSASMMEVEISEACDTSGNYVGKIGDDGKRHRPIALKPTQKHNIRFLLGYQIGYMYLRYLLWNFSGRQNDIPSTGEIEHGNFITGVTAIDNAMLGDNSLMPPSAFSDNPGYNRYFMLPLILGLIGAIATAFGPRIMRRVDTVILIVFLLTGVAIVVYLNQNTGEARERDYSFLGSYMAYSLWIALGSGVLSIWVRKIFTGIKYIASKANAALIVTALLLLLIPIEMLCQNYNDHDRSHRTAAEDYAVNIIQSFEKDAIVFVDGDNLTFPLWYAREVLGLRRDVRIVSVTYLTQPGYIQQLMVDNYDSPALPITARPEQIASGRFASVGYCSDTTLLVPDAIEALKELYADTAPFPRLLASQLLLKNPTGKDFKVDLAKTASGSSTIKRKHLIILDIIATNMACESPRPIYFLNSLNASYYAGTAEMAQPALFAYRIGSETSREMLDSIAFAQLQQLRFGGYELEKKPYTDFTVHRESSIQRTALLSLARRRLEAGDKKQARKAALLAIEKFSPQYVPWRMTSVQGVPFDEIMQCADIIAATATNDNERLMAVKLLRNQYQLAQQWQRYLHGLGSRRNAASRSVRALASKAERFKAMADSIQTSI